MTSSSSGVLVINKPQGMTSHDVVAIVRKKFGTRKVGHAGTLDPMATGVLVLGLNNATRLLDFIVAGNKEYEATVRLGQSTVTDDKEGEVLATGPASHLNDSQILEAFAKYVGKFAQLPAKVSAKKVDGKRAHNLVRAGIDFELKPKEVEVFDLQVLNIKRTEQFVDVDIKVRCSAGTYIRSIARDTGDDLEVGGHLTALHRTNVEPFDISQAQNLDADLHLIDLFTATTSILQTVEADEVFAQKIVVGKPLPTNLVSKPGVFAIVHQNRVMALAEQSDTGNVIYRAVLSTEVAG